MDDRGSMVYDGAHQLMVEANQWMMETHQMIMDSVKSNFTLLLLKPSLFLSFSPPPTSSLFLPIFWGPDSGFLFFQFLSLPCLFLSF